MGEGGKVGGRVVGREGKWGGKVSWGVCVEGRVSGGGW